MSPLALLLFWIIKRMRSVYWTHAFLIQCRNKNHHRNEWAYFYAILWRWSMHLTSPIYTFRRTCLSLPWSRCPSTALGLPWPITSLGAPKPPNTAKTLLWCRQRLSNETRPAERNDGRCVGVEVTYTVNFQCLFFFLEGGVGFRVGWDMGFFWVQRVGRPEDVPQMASHTEHKPRAPLGVVLPAGRTLQLERGREGERERGREGERERGREGERERGGQVLSLSIRSFCFGLMEFIQGCQQSPFCSLKAVCDEVWAEHKSEVWAPFLLPIFTIPFI